MEKAYALLGIHESASLTEIEEAYRHKKRLYDLSRFVEDSLDWQFARARNEALDEAYRYAAAAVQSKASGSWRKERKITRNDDRDDWETSEPSLLGEFAGLFLVCPIVIFVMQLAAPTIISELTGFRGTIWPLDVMMLFLGYIFPLLVRFVLLRRPLSSLPAALFLFPVTLLFTDLFTSVLLRFSILSRDSPAYVPAFYLVGLGPLFILLHAHCTILTMPYFAAVTAPKKSEPFLRRLTAHTFTLSISLALSMVLCTSLNMDKTRQVSEASASVPKQETPWRTVKLTDAGEMEMPGEWHVEDSSGKLTRARHENGVQYIREGLTVRPYGRREAGLDFAFELLVYWWTNLSGHTMSPPREIVDKIQDNQFDFLTREFPSITFHSRDVTTLEGRRFNVSTVETDSIPGLVVRFKNIVLRHGDKVYTLTAGYPAHDETAFSKTLNTVLSRWRLE